MKVLIINSGSSSLKFQLLDFDKRVVMAQGICERIGIDNSRIQFRRYDEEKIKHNRDFETHEDAVRAMVEILTSPQYGVISDLAEIEAIGHRVVHGAESFAEPAVVTEEVKDCIREAFLWGPLHNPANLLGIEVCERLMEGIPQVAVFDTAFHQTMPPEAYLYALPYELYEEHGVRRYGFHGTSHQYVSERAAAMCESDPENCKIIVCHLGNGSSLCAVKNGKSIDTSMGLTPLAGLPMGTRCGDIDPAIPGFIADVEHLTLQEIDNLMNKRSGVLGLSGISSDFRDLVAARDRGHARAKLAIDIFTYQLKKYIGAYAAALGGLDILCFTAGVGENDDELRYEVCKDLGFLGIEIDQEKNRGLRSKEARISTKDSKVAVLVIPTNEELSIARQTVRLLGLADA
ncbi:MAG TPA: acetate kinase [Clostridiaceae bacterium]|nr:acetate kinase [Clostridiaceae bacterium]